MEYTSFYLPEIMDNIANMLGEKAAAKGLDLYISVEKDVPKALLGDPFRLEQVLINLTTNAIKFTERGEIVVRVSMLNEYSNGRKKLFFSVQDTGIGISKEQLISLFNSFMQADGSTTRKYGGTGLGLAISKSLVEKMGGEIGVDSEVDKGSNFFFTIELEQDKEHMSAPILLPPENLKGTKVLVVDDKQTARDLLKEMMEAFHFRVVTASSGVEAIEKLKEAPNNDPFSLVLMDWRMPGMDGIETTCKIKNELKYSQLPMIIMVTAYGRDEIMHRSEQAGINAFLHKPVSESLLFNTVMDVLGMNHYVLTVENSRETIPSAEIFRLSGAHILLAEDSFLNQQVAVELMEDAGIKVDIANNGAEAVEKILLNNPCPYDAVLMDIQMPVMDGFEATSLIRAHDWLQDLPVIALTAHAVQGDREKCLSVGMNDYITKPIGIENFFTTLLRWVKLESPAASCVSKDSKGDAEADIITHSMENIDVKKAVAMLGGNSSLYIKLLNRFINDNHKAVDRIQEALNKGEKRLAERLAHTLKGEAGSIGAFTLAADIQQMEKAIHTKEVSIEMIKGLKKSLSKVIEELQVITGESIESNVNKKKPVYKLNKSEITSLMEQLEKALNEGSFSALKHFEELKDGLAGAVKEDSLEAMEDYVKSFSMEEALDKLYTIARTLNLTWKGRK